MNRLIDTNVYLGSWPFRYLYGSTRGELCERLTKSHVTQAWVGSFDGLWQRDLAEVNRRLTRECRAAEGVELLPFGSVNPLLPDWRDDVRRCHEEHGMRGIRLHPNYHGYDLTLPACAELLAAADERKLIVQLVVSMEDERTQSPLARVKHTDLAPLATLLAKMPQLAIVVLNAFRGMKLDLAGRLVQAGNVSFDLAMLEGVAGIEKLIVAVTLERIVFGSLFPLFYHESATLKLAEGAVTGQALEAISAKNAERLLAAR